MVTAMTIVCLSLSHRFVPAELLEKLAVPAGEVGGVLAGLRAVPGVEEAVVLSTCNRVEVYAALSGTAGRVTEAVADLLAARGQVPADQLTQMAQILPGSAAAEHLFSVACGLESMAVGEDQIVAQIKAASRAAAAARTVGPLTHYR
jgi:glutamyl-tRNA reductase